MKTSLGIPAALAFFALTVWPASADTNLEIHCMVRPLNLSLTAWSGGQFHTNGILAFTKSESMRLSGQDLIESLNGKPVYTLAKAVTNWITIKTNRNPNPIPDEYITNHFQRSYLVNGPAVTASFSSAARLLLVESLGVNSPGPIPVIRDGVTPTDYSISDYFSVRNVGVSPSAPSAVVKSARYDTLHGLVDSTEATVKSYVFDDQSTGSSGHIFFDLQGLASEHVASVTRTNTVLGARAGGRLSANVSGVGQLGATNEFNIIRGTVTAGDGKLEVK